MRVWILNQYAATPSEQMTSGFDMARELVTRGHEVTLFASSFSHYRFQELRLKEGERFKFEVIEGVRFAWIRTFPYSQNNWRRMVNMLSFGWRAWRLGLALKEKPDIVIGVCVHPIAGLAAYLLAKAKGVRFVYEVRDLWPLTLIVFGKLSPRSPVALALGVLEKFLFRKARAIITTLKYADEYAESIGVSKGKVYWVPNGLCLDRYHTLAPYGGGLTQPFKIMYLGGHVNANALDVILRAARIVQERSPHQTRFIFVGGGQEKARLITLANDLGLQNVEFREPVPKNDLWKVMSEADAFVLALRNYPIYRYGISLNKLNDYLAARRPIIFAGQARYNPVELAGAGITVPPENPEALAEAIKKMVMLTPSERIGMGERGSHFLKTYHEIGVLARQYEGALLS